MGMASNKMFRDDDDDDDENERCLRIIRTPRHRYGELV